jgi:proteasome assembly chaperone (PAC2) family protein
MGNQGIHIKELPELKNALLIAGFDGWGNAMDLSRAMASYLIRKLEAKYFAILPGSILIFSTVMMKIVP